MNGGILKCLHFPPKSSAQTSQFKPSTQILLRFSTKSRPSRGNRSVQRSVFLAENFCASWQLRQPTAGSTGSQPEHWGPARKSHWTNECDKTRTEGRGGMFLGCVPYKYCCAHGRSQVCGETWVSPRKGLKKKCLDVIISRARGDQVMGSLRMWMSLLWGWSLNHKSVVKYFQWNKTSDNIKHRASHLHFNLRQRGKRLAMHSML